MYFSELEREAVLLSTKSLLDKLPSQEISQVFAKLARDYDPHDPLPALTEAIQHLGALLKLEHQGPDINKVLEESTESPLYFVTSGDRNSPLPVPVIKGKKEIN
jgi:hypothetical protein